MQQCELTPILNCIDGPTTYSHRVYVLDCLNWTQHAVLITWKPFIFLWICFAEKQQQQHSLEQKEHVGMNWEWRDKKCLGPVCTAIEHPWLQTHDDRTSKAPWHPSTLPVWNTAGLRSLSLFLSLFTTDTHSLWWRMEMERCWKDSRSIDCRCSLLWVSQIPEGRQMLYYKKIKWPLWKITRYNLWISVTGALFT